MPWDARIVPVFSTLAAKRYTSPLWAVIVPALRIAASEAPVKLRSLPFLKASSVRLAVDAMKPPTSITAPFPTKIPLGLSRYTCPLACRVPRIWEGSPEVTRFRTEAVALG